MKVGASDGVFDDLQVEDAVKREGWENRVFRSAKLELVSRGALATPRPRVWPPQRQPVEMAFVSKDELFGAVFGIDDGLVPLSILLISLQSRL